VGLHARDAERLGVVLRRLADAGNAVVVVEHDPVLIRAADHAIDLGPGPGQRGGQVVYEGPPAGMGSASASITGAHLDGRMELPAPPARRSVDPARVLRVVGACENNLRDVDVTVPLGMLVCVTGVSGSGKSTLVDQVLYRNLRRAFGQGESEPGSCRAVEGAANLGGAVMVDQSPLGGSSRVNAATYMSVLEPLRRAFESGEEARARGLGPAAFSFNSAAGAQNTWHAPVCKGWGYLF
jgi:excinuclease ABC subunit A